MLAGRWPPPLAVPIKRAEARLRRAIKALHKTIKKTHSPAGRMVKLLASLQWVGWSKKELLQVCSKVQEECKVCGNFGKVQMPATSLRAPVPKKFPGWMDVLTIKHAQGIKATLIVDEGTRFVAGEIVTKIDAKTLVESYILKYGCVQPVHAPRTAGGGCLCFCARGW